MTIKYSLPYVVPNSPNELDTDDCFSIEVGMKGIEMSNDFLYSLWNEFNKAVAPSNSPQRCPWFYSPQRFSGKKSHAIRVGIMQTTIGELLVLYMFASKGNIDKMLFYNISTTLNLKESNLIKDIVAKAIENKDNLQIIHFRAELKIHLENINGIYGYGGDNFCFHQENGKTYVNFRISAIDKYESLQEAYRRLNNLCAFLTVEFNARCSFGDLSLYSEEFKTSNSEKFIFAGDYIDFYPIDFESKMMLLSSEAYDYINTRIFASERHIHYKKEELSYLASSKHISDGLEKEEKLGRVPVIASDSITYTLAPRRIVQSQEYITSALMSYMSALECATSGGTVDVCQECGAPKYKIAQRVRDLVALYLNDDLAGIMKKIYSYRCKFLHEGRLAVDTNYTETIPLLSEHTGSGMEDLGMITIKMNGSSMGLDIANIREWSTYVLRCHFRNFYDGRTKFGVEDISNNQCDSDNNTISLTIPSPLSISVIPKIIRNV